MTLRNEPAITPDLVASHGLKPDEYQRILDLIGRVPSFTELGIFSAMWNEHCSYKSSRIHLRGLPTKAPWVIQGPGENAGVIDIGDGLAVVFKMESHNHPSFIEPYQGATTGVGGILRDVFTMGARPIACLNALSFGDPAHPKTRHLVSGVVAGVGGKYVKSNAIVYCKDGMTIGVGAGQMSRVDSARIAKIKAENAGLVISGCVVASDAFFPFRDGLDVLAQAGATAVIQPGGSVRDAEVIAAADEQGIAMVLTGFRHFRH